MESVNFVVLGDESIAKKLGKKGTSTDLTIYDKKETTVIRTFTVPSSFPEKIQVLFQAINMAEHVIFDVIRLDKYTGEQIVALDTLKKSRGLLCHSYEVDRGKLLAMIKGTVVEGYKLVEESQLYNEINQIGQIHKDGAVRVVIDHCFDVKGAGTVILGKVVQGQLKVHSNLRHLTSGTDVLVKSIQMHDDPVEEANSPARVGLSVKGITPDDVQRGDMLCSDESIKQSQEIVLDFSMTAFFKSALSEGQTFLINVGLQIRPCKIVALNPMRLSLAKPVVFDTDDICVMLKPESETIRIVGSGVIRKE